MPEVRHKTVQTVGLGIKRLRNSEGCKPDTRCVVWDGFCFGLTALCASVGTVTKAFGLGCDVAAPSGLSIEAIEVGRRRCTLGRRWCIVGRRWLIVPLHLRIADFSEIVTAG